MNVLVLSDIHFGASADHPDFIVRANKKHFIDGHSREMVEEMISAIRDTSLSIDAIFVPGDLTSTGAPAEFIECMELLLRIANAVNVPRERIFVTYGNHDVDWNISKLADGSLPGQGDPHYKTVAACLGPALLKLTPPSYPGPIPGCGQYIDKLYELTVLNSGYDCCHDQKIRNGNLGPDQLDWIQKIPSGPKDKLKILVIHHHPMNLPYPVLIKDLSTLAEGPELLTQIARLEIDFVIHGHRHHAMLHTDMQHGWSKPVTFLCAGSVGAGAKDRNAGDIPNSFHIVSFLGRTPKDGIEGKVLTFCYRGGSGWKKSDYSPQVPLDAEMYFGACSTEAEARAELESLLREEAKAAPTIELPKLHELPLNVRCLTIGTINRIAQDVLSSFGLRMAGEYPNAVFGLKGTKS